MNNHRLFLALLLTISTLFLFQACQSEAEQPPLYQSEDYVDVGEFTSGLEGPVVDQHGNLYFVNLQHNGSIGKVDSIGRLQMWIQQLPEGSTGNGLRIGDQGQFYVADYTGHNVLRISPDGQMVKVHTHNDSMNQPNDLTIGSDNVLYASDPSWADSSGQLWRIDPDGHSLLLEAKMGTTNGVELSPDERTLYVNESIQRRVWAYRRAADGSLSDKRLLIAFEDFGLDGMRCDRQGNLYIARYGKGVIAKVTPAGELLREIPLQGQKPTNLAFGGPDGKTCYVTLQDRGFIEQFRVEEPGRLFKKQNIKK